MVRYALTIFLGALLLFLVQPLMGKYILPWFGGGSGVWTVCLLFFQITLVAGYAYAHGVVKWLGPRAQAVVHLALLAGAIALLPIAPGEDWKPTADSEPTWRILVLLTVCLGGPFLMLSSTGPLLQAWFARVHPGRSPYRLYALSNAGSLLGLLGYPFVIEPLIARHMQAMAWSAGFAVFALLSGWCAISQLRCASRPAIASKSGSPRAAMRPTSSESTHIIIIDRLLWLALPGISTAMLLAVSSHITEDIAPIPLLWVVPLAIYLITFIVCFEWPVLYVRGVWATLMLAGMAVAALLARTPQPTLDAMIGGQVLILVSCCMICHGELYRRRPEPGRLTSYYLAIAIGGALGGAFVSLAAPLIFATHAEYDFALHGGAALLLLCVLLDPTSAIRRRSRGSVAWLLFIAVWIVVISANLTVWAQRYRLSVENLRNFYGTMSLILVNRENPATMNMRLMHGRITHGIQIADPQYRRWPTTYFGVNSGIGRILNQRSDQPRRVGVVGLGIGTLAAYGQPGDVYRFYEINPQVIRVANKSFTYLSDSPARTEVIPGDARLSLEREEPQNYEVLVLDAFTGDAVPMHLLTKEAFDVYQRHLKPDGVIAVHITNRYVDLARPLEQIARALGMSMRITVSPGDPDNLLVPSTWALMSHDPKRLEDPLLQPVLVPPDPFAPPLELWTDEFASVLSVVEWGGVPLRRPIAATQPSTAPATAPQDAN